MREFVQSRLDRSSERVKADDTASQSHEAGDDEVCITSGMGGIELASAGEVGWSVEEQEEEEVQWKAYDGKKDREGDGPGKICVELNICPRGLVKLLAISLFILMTRVHNYIRVVKQ